MSGQHPEHVEVAFESRLWSGDHRAALARHTDADDDVTDAQGSTRPCVFEPVAAVGVEHEVGAEPADVPRAVGMEGLAGAQRSRYKARV